jgi:pyruvate/2-oxoglutarate dehydrogenase complex dihydrolipoamide acyltransferase (E2) component
VEVYLGFDHRVMDGALAARAIRLLDQALQGPVLAELRAQAALRAA